MTGCGVRSEGRLAEVSLARHRFKDAERQSLEAYARWRGDKMTLKRARWSGRS